MLRWKLTRTETKASSRPGTAAQPLRPRPRQGTQRGAEMRPPRAEPGGPRAPREGLAAGPGPWGLPQPWGGRHCPTRPERVLPQLEYPMRVQLLNRDFKELQLLTCFQNIPKDHLQSQEAPSTGAEEPCPAPGSPLRRAAVRSV